VAKRPILASSCAAAAGAAEARYRIDRPIEETRRTTVIALDAGAEKINTDAARTASERVRFVAAASLTACGETGPLLEDSDLVILVATSELQSSTASGLGRVCAGTGVPVFGLVVGRPLERASAVSALRAQTSMLVASETPSDLADILSDLRA
jgi:hypothetical protein